MVQVKLAAACLAEQATTAANAPLHFWPGMMPAWQSAVQLGSAQELVEMMETARQYQNNVQVMQTAKQLTLEAGVVHFQSYFSYFSAFQQFTWAPVTPSARTRPCWIRDKVGGMVTKAVSTLLPLGLTLVRVMCHPPLGMSVGEWVTHGPVGSADRVRGVADGVREDVRAAGAPRIGERDAAVGVL